MNKTINLWIDDLRLPPNNYFWIKSVYEAKDIIDFLIKSNQINTIQNISLDHDSGIYYPYGGDYIEILKYMEFMNNQYPEIFTHINFYIHSFNPVGVVNMRAICQKNNWKLIF